MKPTSIPFEVEGRHIVLVDDVLYTGRTTRAALNEIFDYGRPAKVELAVLADRGGRGTAGGRAVQHLGRDARRRGNLVLATRRQRQAFVEARP